MLRRVSQWRCGAGDGPLPADANPKYEALTAQAPSSDTIGWATSDGADARWLLALHRGVLAVAGASLLALSVMDALHHRSADSVLLTAWIRGTFVVAGLVNWSTKGRTAARAVGALPRPGAESLTRSGFSASREEVSGSPTILETVDRVRLPSRNRYRPSRPLTRSSQLPVESLFSEPFFS